MKRYHELAQDDQGACDAIAVAIESAAQDLQTDGLAPTLRDRFAMAALTGLLACPHADREALSTYHVVAEDCYRWADAMIAAGNPDRVRP